MNEQLIISFKQKLLKGQAVFGPFMKTCDPAFAEAAGYAGMDFAILDMEHGPISVQEMQNNIRAAQIAGILPVVRVPAVTEEAIGKALDIDVYKRQPFYRRRLQPVGRKGRFCKMHTAFAQERKYGKIMGVRGRWYHRYDYFRPHRLPV